MVVSMCIRAHAYVRVCAYTHIRTHICSVPSLCRALARSRLSEGMTGAVCCARLALLASVLPATGVGGSSATSCGRRTSVGFVRGHSILLPAEEYWRQTTLSLRGGADLARDETVADVVPSLPAAARAAEPEEGPKSDPISLKIDVDAGCLPTLHDAVSRCPGGVYVRGHHIIAPDDVLRLGNCLRCCSALDAALPTATVSATASTISPLAPLPIAAHASTENCRCGTTFELWGEDFSANISGAVVLHNASGLIKVIKFVASMLCVCLCLCICSCVSAGASACACEVCVCVCCGVYLIIMNAHPHSCSSVQQNARTHISTHTHTHIHTHAYTHTPHTHTHAHACANIYVRTYVYMCICVSM